MCTPSTLQVFERSDRSALAPEGLDRSRRGGSSAAPVVSMGAVSEVPSEDHPSCSPFFGPGPNRRDEQQNSFVSRTFSGVLTPPQDTTTARKMGHAACWKVERRKVLLCHTAFRRPFPASFRAPRRTSPRHTWPYESCCRKRRHTCRL